MSSVDGREIHDWVVLTLDISVSSSHDLENDRHLDFESYAYDIQFKRWAGEYAEEREGIAAQLAIVVGKSIHRRFGTRVMVVEEVQNVLARWPGRTDGRV